ncbi:MAG TPA: VIT domain-containing protein [Verrucomicrobiae bacterium]|nr:VIT domain-containing protein [Verrucomicrobiae bacterium]
MKIRLQTIHVGTFLVVLAAAVFLAGCYTETTESMRNWRPPAPYESVRGESSYTARNHSSDYRGPGSGADELWIIARGTPQNPAQPDAKLPGCGELLAFVPDQEKVEIPLPLKHTGVRASVAGYISTVEVKQEFQNPYDIKIEAVYVFPLPHNAAVSEFVMTIGDRRIRGIIRERKEAEEIYQEAKSQGYAASLLTEERPNIFRQSVANIEPGKEIGINMTYYEPLEYNDGWFEFVFPMVVGPRYNPDGPTNGVGAVARGLSRASGQATEIEYLKPEERSGHDISLHLDIDAGVDIEEFTCATHRVLKEPSDSQHLSVTLASDDQIPNKDFVLRYRVACERIKSNLLVHRDQQGGYFTMMLIPPRDLRQLNRAPMEMVFVLDCSGSMAGQPIEQAKAAIRQGLRWLQPGDSFQIINFSEGASQLGSAPLDATAENVQRGMDYVAALNGDGPTEMIEGVKAALNFQHDPERLRFVCFLTDGYIGNEAQILAAVHERIGASRIFTVGVGSSPNRYLLDHMAKLGRGAVASLGLQDDAAKVMDDFFERVSHPALTDIQVDWGNLRASEIYPSRVPDLFVGRPVILTGRFSGDETSVRVTGNAAGQQITFAVPADSKDANDGRALPKIWARSKIAELADQAAYDSNPRLPQAMKQLALDYGLMSTFTAFIAVDSTRTTEGTQGVTVPVPVPVPKGVNYDNTVQNQEKEKQ